MRQEVGGGLRHVARSDYLTANIQVGKQSERGDDQVEAACNAGEYAWMIREAHTVTPGRRPAGPANRRRLPIRAIDPIAAIRRFSRLSRPTERTTMMRSVLGVVVGVIVWMVGFWILANLLAQLWPDYAVHGR